MRTLASLAALLPGLAVAQSALVTEFPTDAQPLDPPALKTLLANRVFSVKPAQGAEWRLEFKDNGYAFINVGSRSDSGAWRVEGSNVCVDWRSFPPGCGEYRRAGERIYTKRSSNGEVVLLQPR